MQGQQESGYDRIDAIVGALELGEDPSDQSNGQYTPLITAILKRRLTDALTLLMHGADPLSVCMIRFSTGSVVALDALELTASIGEYPTFVALVHWVTSGGQCPDSLSMQ